VTVFALGAVVEFTPVERFPFTLSEEFNPFGPVAPFGFKPVLLNSPVFPVVELTPVLPVVPLACVTLITGLLLRAFGPFVPAGFIPVLLKTPLLGAN
jgi:hypothetical protein